MGRPLTPDEKADLIHDLGGVEAVLAMSVAQLRAHHVLRDRGHGDRAARGVRDWAAAMKHFAPTPVAPALRLAPPPAEPAPARAEVAPLLVDELHEPNPPPAAEAPLAERLAVHQERFGRRRAQAAAAFERTLDVGTDRPLCIVHFGDPHLDDDGCDWGLINEWLEVCQQPGVWAGNIGDTTNNWVGRLQKLYMNQECSEGEAFERARHFASRARWLYWVLGNHDKWNQGTWMHREILRGSEVRVMASTDARIRLRWPSGDEFVVWARHSFKGSSQWNTLHGNVKAARMSGYRAGLYVDGHRHNTAAMVEPHPDGDPYFALRLAGFKRLDHYAAELQFPESEHGAAVMTVIDPTASPMGRCRFVWTPAEARQVLAELQRRPVLRAA